MEFDYLPCRIIRIYSSLKRFNLHGRIYLRKHFRQVRVRLVIEHHETGVHVNMLVAFINGNGIGVSTDVIVFLEQGDVVLLVEKMSAAHASDSCSYDG